MGQIGRRLAENIRKGDKREAFRQFELDLAGHFDVIIMANAGSQVKGFIDGLLTLEEYRGKKSSDIDDNRINPTQLIEKFFTTKE